MDGAVECESSHGVAMFTVQLAPRMVIKALKAENRRLREDVEILRGATTFFAGELDPRNR